jgi:cold shock CspA family protein
MAEGTLVTFNRAHGSGLILSDGQDGTYVYFESIAATDGEGLSIGDRVSYQAMDGLNNTVARRVCAVRTAK